MFVVWRDNDSEVIVGKLISVLIEFISGMDVEKI